MTTNKRHSNHIVSAQVAFTKDGSETQSTVEISGLPCTWQWDEMTRDCAEYSAIIDYVVDNLDFDWFSVVAWSSTHDGK